MSQPRVVNIRSGEPYDVLVDRRTKWGNPFKIGPRADGDVVLTREQAISHYRAWLLSNEPGLIEDAKRELRGKNLGCWCAPLPCHADVLLEIANS